jgi:hypothetical protein
VRAYVIGAAQMAPQGRGMGISAPPQMMGRGMPPPPGLPGGPPPGMGGPPPGVHCCVYLCAQVCSCSSRARPRTLCGILPARAAADERWLGRVRPEQAWEVRLAWVVLRRGWGAACRRRVRFRTRAHSLACAHGILCDGDMCVCVVEAMAPARNPDAPIGDRDTRPACARAGVLALLCVYVWHG